MVSLEFFIDIILPAALWPTHEGGTLLVAQLVEALRYKPEAAGSIPDGVIGIFH